MARLPEDISKRLQGSLDLVIDEYLANPHVIFANDTERRREHYKGIERKLVTWNKRRTCIFRGCSVKSIRRSHAIQKSGPLKSISQNAKVCTPQFDHELGKIRLISRGLSQASVFPGFCEQHELLFAQFENTKSLESKEAISLQIYRSICREIVRVEHDLSSMKEMAASYIDFRNKKLAALMNDRLGSEWLREHDVTINSLNFTHDPTLQRATESINDSNKALGELRNEHLHELEMAVSGSPNDALKPVVITIDVVLPVALSGLGSFYVKEANSTRRVFAILGIFPNNGKGTTSIFMHGKAADTEFIHSYIGHLRNPFDILNMVEQFMIRGTDHWFVPPSLWEKKCPPDQERILAEILDGSKGLSHPLSFSIFDDLRREMIQTWEESMPSANRDQVAILDRERSKLDASVF